MADTQTDVITTRTFFHVPSESDAAALPPDEYEARFLQVQADTVRAFRNHPPIPDEVLNDRDTARRYFGVWQMNHSFFAKMFPSYLMNIAAKCPYQDVRREILHDCWDEEVSDPDADGMCHIEVLYYDSGQLGITREEAEAFEPTPIFMACMHALDNLSRTLTWQGGYAAVGGLESIRVAVKRGYLDKGEFEGPWAASANRVEKLCGIPEGSPDERRAPSGQGPTPRRRGAGHPQEVRHYTGDPGRNILGHQDRPVVPGHHHERADTLGPGRHRPPCRRARRHLKEAPPCADLNTTVRRSWSGFGYLTVMVRSTTSRAGPEPGP